MRGRESLPALASVRPKPDPQEPEQAWTRECLDRGPAPMGCRWEVGKAKAVFALAVETGAAMGALCGGGCEVPRRRGKLAFGALRGVPAEGGDRRTLRVLRQGEGFHTPYPISAF